MKEKVNGWHTDGFDDDEDNTKEIQSTLHMFDPSRLIWFYCFCCCLWLYLKLNPAGDRFSKCLINFCYVHSCFFFARFHKIQSNTFLKCCCVYKCVRWNDMHTLISLLYYAIVVAVTVATVVIITSSSPSSSSLLFI